MSILNSYSVLGNLVALSATQSNNISVADHMLIINTAPQMDFRKINSTNGGYLAAVAETRGVLTITPTAANSAFFGFRLEQDIPSQGTVTMIVGYTSLASGDTATTICNAFRRAIIANPQFNHLVTSGTATCILTAAAGYPAIRATALAANTAVVVTTAYVLTRGTYNDLIRAGVAAADIASGATYSQIAFTFVDSFAGDWQLSATVRTHTLYVQVGATNKAAFDTLMASTLNAFVPAGTTADPEALSVNS